MSRWPRRGRRIRLAKAFGVSGESARKWLAGESMPKLATASKIAKEIGVSVNWLLNGQGPKHPASTDPLAPDPRFPRTPSEEDFALIPHYDVKGSCGNGHMNGHVEVKGGLAFQRAWLDKLSVNPQQSAVIYAHGESMAPTINDGDVVLLDLTQTEPRNGLIYALRAGDEVRIKRMFCSVAGVWTLSSDNLDKTRYPDEVIATPSDLVVIGRCRWTGGAL